LPAYLPRVSLGKSELMYCGRNSSTCPLMGFFIDVSFRAGGRTRADDADSIGTISVRNDQEAA